MRIALVTDSYHPTMDGVVLAVDTERKAMTDLGHEVFIIAPDPGQDAREDGVFYFPSRRFRTYEGYFVPIFPSNKIEIIKKLNVDIIHVHGVALMATKAMISAKILDKPIVITYHTTIDDVIEHYSPIKLPKNILVGLSWVYLKRLLDKADGIIVPTKSTADEILGHGVKPRIMRIVPTGVDIVKFNPETDGSTIIEKHGLNNSRIVLHVGRISFEKNIDTIIKAVNLLPDDVKLIIGGKGPIKSDLEKLCKELGMENRVIFTGFIPDADLPKYYAAADVVVSASKFETLGMSVVEAMSSGSAVVCANERAFRDFVRDGDNGFLFNGDFKECSEAILKALNCDENVRKHARETAESFSIEKSMNGHLEMYKAAMSEKHRRSGELNVY